MKRSGGFLLAFLVACGLAAPARAELTPDQVAIIAMANSPASRELAEYYAKARGIPESHIFLIPGDVRQRIARYYWNETVRPGILEWLRKHESFAKIRCLVTMWDVPLEISPISSTSPEITERTTYLAQVRANLVIQAGTLVRMLEAPGGPTPTTGTAAELPPNISLEDLYSRFAKAMKPAQERLRSAKTTEERQKAGEFMDRVLVTLGGDQGLVRLLTPHSQSPQLPPERVARLAYLTGRVEGLRQGVQSLGMLRGTIASDEQAVELNQALGGLFGAIQWIDQQQYLMKQNFTGASFDSELSLLLWPDPPMLSWVPNPWHYSFDNTPARRRTTLLVSRLSAPTPQVVQRMIDDAIATEKTSLTGTIYVDARGLAQDPKRSRNDLFVRYDQSLLDLVARLQKHASLNVMLDTKKETFAVGSCPQAALYCGWHSPGAYVDAFQWSTGAVGYHLSSLEAFWLQLNDDDRVQGKTPWCPSMLVSGACATVGSCREAYLSAFPLPDDFFSLLLTGKYTLVETYYRTCPFLSWTMLLVGDPLYNPYKNTPKLSEEFLPERMSPTASAKEAAKTRAEQPGTPPTSPPTEEPTAPKPSQDEIVLPGLNS
jgi:uncharacterized protein (TIGR03790 family)